MSPLPQDNLLAELPRIVLCGIRNAGKSSLMNTLFERPVSLTSETPGTTTDPVTRRFELPQLGPVAITDTAGIDDFGRLGEKRVKRSLSDIDAANIILFVTPGNQPPLSEEIEFLKTIQQGGKLLFIAVTFADCQEDSRKRTWLKEQTTFTIDNSTQQGGKALREALGQADEAELSELTPLEGLVKDGSLLLMVVPIDSAAPKGRIILPQMETLRDALDRGCTSVVVREHELADAYKKLKKRPDLVITDSQAFHQVASLIPPDQPLTSFSLLFARKKGDLSLFIAGLSGITAFPQGGTVLVLEACSHQRRSDDDIGTVKIPKLFHSKVDKSAQFLFKRSLPSAETKIDLVIHCGSCMIHRNRVLSRLKKLEEREIPVVNYGVFLAWANGLIPRAIEPFPLKST